MLDYNCIKSLLFLFLCFIFVPLFFIKKGVFVVVLESGLPVCRYVPSFIPPPLATKGRDYYEKKVSFVAEAFPS